MKNVILYPFFYKIHYTQQTFQRRFNVVFRLIWRRGVAQRQMNVEITLRTSTLKFKTLNKVETKLCFSTLNWTTLDNVETMLSFSTPIFTTLGNVEATLRIRPFGKKIKPRFKNKIIFLNWKNLLDSKWLDWTPDEIIRENLWEFQYAFKYVHQTLIIVNED